MKDILTGPNAIVTLAIIAGVQVVLMTVVTAWIAARKERRDADIRAAEKKLEYDRQDEVAANAAKSARELLEAQRQTNRLTEDLTHQTQLATEQTQQQLSAIDEQAKKIHTLVNSDMTAARSNERDSTKLLLLSLRQVMTLNLKLGVTAGAADLEAITRAEERVAELDAILADRAAAQHKMEEETAARVAATGRKP
jgi:hypothetical protein